jgi:F1F0 ATPase subunit 2
MTAMNEFWYAQPAALDAYVYSFAGGVVGALFFYVGLWLTVRIALAARHPVVIALLSFAVRVIVVTFVIFWVSGGMIDHVLACLVAVIAMRFLLVRLLPPPVSLTHR